MTWKESFHWDRCDFLQHGEKMKLLTDIDSKSGADVNAGLMVVSPNKWEYNEMIQELTSPIKTWMGSDKKHKDFGHLILMFYLVESLYQNLIVILNKII